MVDPSNTSSNSCKKRSREEVHDRNSSNNSNNNNVDSFLNSMTFAAPSGGFGRGGCDCDECGGSAFIPQAIVEAIRKHKRMRNEQMPMKRSQVRELVRRSNDSQQQSLFVYKLTLPLASDPLVEFGSSYRLVWIKYLPDESVLKTIGKGIVGSQDEEQGRTALDWQQGDVYLVPSNGGKAVAWLHESIASKEKDDSTKDPNEKSKPSGHAIMYVCKVPSLDSEETNPPSSDIHTKNDGDDDEGTCPEWHQIIRKTCQEILDAKTKLERDNKQDDGGATMKYYKLPEDAADRLRQVLSNL